MKVQLEPLFVREYKKIIKKHYDKSLIDKIIDMLANKETLPNKYKNHSLKGDLKDYQECHVENDLLLIYQIENDILYLVRIGNHKDLLNK